MGEPIIDVERGPGYRFYKVVFDYQPPEISITPRDGFAAPNPPNLQAGMIFQVLGEMDDGAIVLGVITKAIGGQHADPSTPRGGGWEGIP